jgi:hypothetical protein
MRSRASHWIGARLTPAGMPVRGRDLGPEESATGRHRSERRTRRPPVGNVSMRPADQHTIVDEDERKLSVALMAIFTRSGTVCAEGELKLRLWPSTRLSVVVLG